MTYFRFLLAASIASIYTLPNSAMADGVIARCGPSKGMAYILRDPSYPDEESGWFEDGISNGKLVLINLGEEWDILFDDVAGAYGYRDDGATVFPLGETEGKFLIGAFRGTYVDIFTFDRDGGELLWSSHKIGTLVKKVAVYRSECKFTAP